jgi:hypothetical protein
MKANWRMIYSPFLWAAVLTAFIPLQILGLIAVPLAWATRCRVSSRVDINRRIWTSRVPWLWLWCNDEDGLLPPAGHPAMHPTWPDWLNAFRWGALRNTVNNARFVKWFSPPIEADKIRFVEGDEWEFVWQGWRTRFEWSNDNYWFACGWKVDVMDAYGVSPTDWRLHGMGFGVRLKRFT